MKYIHGVVLSLRVVRYFSIHAHLVVDHPAYTMATYELIKM